MALAADLMGLGVSPLLASRTANAGNGPLTATAAGSAFSTGTKIQATQFLVSVSGADGTKGVSMPSVGGDGGTLLGDDYIINNLSTSTLKVFMSTGVLVSSGSSNNSFASVTTHTTATFYPISTTQWIAVLGQ